MLKKLLSMATIGLVGVIIACQPDDNIVAKNDVSQDVLDKIHALGFSTENMQVTDGGYLVEGDIMLHDHDLNATADSKVLRIAEVEHYRTNNLVTGLPRTIRVAISTNLPSAYVTALDEAIRRYNAENLRVTFQRVSSSYNILITRSPSGASYLASAGFPTRGNPYGTVRVNSSYLGSNPGTNYLATILAHEIGHCIGFRHTDYMDRSFSCGGSPVNEGASNVGAVHIPGTPTGPNSGSWMLACIGSGVNRPFNTNDRTALNYLY